MKLYIRVTKDKYEHITAVADTQRELARICGVKENTIATSLHFARTGEWGWCQYRVVEVDDE